MASWYTPAPFVPVKYVPASLKDVIRAKVVLSIQVTAHQKTTAPYAGGYTNHWCLYLKTGDAESVRIDVQPNPQQAATTIPGGSKADVIVSQLGYAMSRNAIYYRTLAVPPGLYVGHVIDYIVASGRDKYEFTAQNVGCRRWVVDTLNLLRHRGWLNEAGVAASTGDIGKIWPEQTPLEMGAGGYYAS